MPTPIRDSIDPASKDAVDEGEKKFAQDTERQKMLGKGLSAPWKAAPAAAAAADVVSTYAAMKRGAKEGNPLYKIGGGSPEATTAIAALLSAGQLRAADKLAKGGHRTAAKILSAVKIGTSGAAAVNNIRNYKKLGSK